MVPSSDDSGMTDLGLCDRHARGPVVDDAPLLNVVLEWPPNARPRARNDEEIVGEDTAFGAAAAQ
jgi:hypothetical protein